VLGFLAAFFSCHKAWRWAPNEWQGPRSALHRIPGSPLWKNIQKSANNQAAVALVLQLTCMLLYENHWSNLTIWITKSLKSGFSFIHFVSLVLIFFSDSSFNTLCISTFLQISKLLIFLYYSLMRVVRSLQCAVRLRHCRLVTFSDFHTVYKYT